MALKHNKLLIGLFIFVALLMLSGFAILNIYAADGYSKYARENESSLLKSIKLNYLNLAADIDNALYPLVDDPQAAGSVVENLSDDIVFAALYDYDGKLLEDFGYSVPDDLPSSIFFENLTFSSGLPRAEISRFNDKLYIQAGILTLDDTVFVVLLNRFGDLLENTLEIYDRELLVYYGDENSFKTPAGAPEIDKATLGDLFRRTMNSQRPESAEIYSSNGELIINALAIYDSDNWDVISFFSTVTSPALWKRSIDSLAVFIWVSGIASLIFALFFLYIYFKKVQKDPKMKKSARFLYGLTAFLPAIVLVAVFSYSIYGESLTGISETVALKNSMGWFGDVERFLEVKSPESPSEFIDRSRGTTGANFVMRKGGSLLASNLTQKRLSNLETISSTAIEGGIVKGTAKLNDVLHTYMTREISGIEATVLYEETSRENTVLSIQFFAIGMILTLLVIAVVSGFIINNIQSSILIKRTFIGYGFLMPALVHLIWWAVGPMGFALFLAFRRWSIVDAAKPFVGLENFIEIFGDFKFWNALKNTAVYSIYVPIGMFISLLLAIAVNKLGKLSIVLRVLYYLPVVTAGVATTIVWRWIFNRDFGVLNFILGLVGIKPIAWLESPQFALISMMIIGIWSAIGSQLLIFLAGLQGIPKDFYDAASVDGASKSKIFLKITLPLLKPTSLFVLVTSVIGSFQVFTPIYVLTQGGPLRSTDVVFYHIWQSAWVDMRMGYAAAQSWILFLLLAVLTFVEFKLFGKESWQAYF